MDSKEDEEISIDFSKIKNFFKSDKKEEKKIEGATQSSSKEEKKEDIELSFNLSKIKKFFKTSEKETVSEDEISIDWSKITNFFKKYGIIFIVLIPIILSIYVRMQAGFLPITDDWATNSVINGIKSQIRAQVSKDNPNLPEANVNTIVDMQMQKLISERKSQIDEQIRQTSAYFKSFFQDEQGKNYMPDIDPYYWFRYTKNIVEHGHPGDVLKDGKPYDNHQLAPVGRFVTGDMFHAYFLAYFYKFIHFLVPDLSLMRSVMYSPIILSAIAVLLVFLIARKIAGNIGGFFAGMIMAVSYAFLGRTLFGHSDTDGWVVLFPLLITWLFIITEESKNTIKTFVLSSIAGFLTGLYTFAWTGWWYIFDFLLATIFVTLSYLVFANFSEIKKNVRLIYLNPTTRNLIIIGIVYFISTALFVTIFSGWPAFRNSFIGPLSFPSIKNPVQGASLWPNVLTTVAELNEGSVNSIINSVGGKFLFLISLIGLALSISRKEGIRKIDFVYILGTAFFYAILFIQTGNRPPLFQSLPLISLLVWIMLPISLRVIYSIYKKDLSYDFKLSILLTLWVVATIFASIKGIRFTLLLAPAFSVAFGVAFGKCYSYISKWFAQELKVHKAIASSIMMVLLLLVYVNPIRGAVGAAGSDIPLINDAWYNALTNIKQDSQENAIITSWWDFGHHFKALAERPVTFDGTTQTSAAAHWVGKLFMTDNEREAVGILRMLDCGSNNAFWTIPNSTNDTVRGIKIINEIILLDRKAAEKKLKSYGFSNEVTEKMISYSHCNAPEAFVIASSDMGSSTRDMDGGKSGVWAHFGSWNFERADLWFNARKKPKEEAMDYMIHKYNYTKDKAENLYFELQSIASDAEANNWIAPWPGYGGTFSCTKSSEKFYTCNNGFQINLSNFDAFATNQQGLVRPRVVAFTSEDGMFKKYNNGTTLDFGLTVVPINKDELLVVLSSKELTGSMFIRLYKTNGHGLKYFKLFDHQQGLTGTNIYTYKVDWEGTNTTIVQEYVDFYRKPEMAVEDKTSVNETQNSSNIS